MSAGARVADARVFWSGQRETGGIEEMMSDSYQAGDLLALLLRRWWLLALGIGLGACVALGALQSLPSAYSTSATQLVKGIPGNATGANYIAAQYAVARAKSYPALVHSSSVLAGVREDLGSEFTDARIRGQLSASNPVDTPLVIVRATGATPQEAQELANSAASHLANFIMEIETISDQSPILVVTAVEAESPTSPSSPNPVLFLSVGATTGLSVGVISALGLRPRETRPRRLKPAPTGAFGTV